MATIDLSSLPAPNVVETLDYETILASRKTRLLSLVPADQVTAVAATLEIESEPLTILLQESSYNELVLRSRVNEAAKAVMLAYATGSDLDHLAARFGVSRLNQESDDSLRNRAQMALEGETVAGSRGSYIFHTLSASSEVKDVAIDSPIPGNVRVTVLSTKGNGVPSPELISEVYTYLSTEDRRPLTDLVTVEAAEIVPFSISAMLNVYPGPASTPILDAAQAAAKSYVTEHAKLGHDITISGLYSCLHQPGVQRVVLTSPHDDVVIGERQAAYCTSITVALGVTDV